MAGPNNIFKSLFKMLKFGASATVGLPVAMSMTAFIGSLFLVAEATSIVETNVKNSVKGQQKIHRNPFFQKISDGLGSALKETWTELGVYAPLKVGSGISSLVKETFKDDKELTKILANLPDIETNRDFFVDAAKEHAEKANKMSQGNEATDLISDLAKLENKPDVSLEEAGKEMANKVNQDNPAASPVPPFETSALVEKTQSQVSTPNA